MKFIPHDYQKYIIDQMIAKKKMIAVVDMGLGKTVCTLSALEELMFNRFEVNKVLVIAPLRVADVTWGDEIDKWDHLNSFKISKIIGTEPKRIDAIKAIADIYVINRENAKWLVDYFVKAKKWPFDMLVIDESSSFKNNKSQRFKALRKVTAITERVIELTGTPSPNGLMDLWPQIYLLDQGERLGRTITSFRDTFFNPGMRNKNIIFNYVPKAKAEEEIHKRINDVAISLTAKDHLKMPPRIDNVIKLKMPLNIKTIYDEMERECIVELEKKDVIMAGSRAVVTNKLLQMANGAVYGEDRKVSIIHDIKLDALQEIIEANEGKSIMVFYNYQHDYDRLVERFKCFKPKTLKTKENIERWNKGEIELLLVHPASMGHGLNLQAGGSIIVWFSLTWSLELYLQANARLYRQGQQNAVVINHLVMEKTVDVDVMRALTDKKVNQDELIEAVKARIKNAKK